MELDLKKFDVRNALENAVTLVKERSLRHGINLQVDFDAQRLKGSATLDIDNRSAAQTLVVDRGERVFR